MNDFMKQSDLSYFYSQHSMNNSNNNAGKQVPSLYPRPKEDDSVFGGMWVQPEEEARKNALSLTGTEIWGPRPSFPSDKNWDGKSSSSGSGRISTTDTEALSKWGGIVPGQQNDWNRRSNISSSSETSLKETPPPLTPLEPNAFMPFFNRPLTSEPKISQSLWKNPQVLSQLQLQQLQQQQELQQKQLLLQLIQQKKMQTSLQNHPSSLSFDAQWLPSHPSKKLIDPATVELYKKIASQLNPSHQTPQTRSKMIQQLVSMGFKKEDVGKALMENDLDYDLTLGELLYKSAFSQAPITNKNTFSLQQQQQTLLLMQQQQQFKSLVDNFQQQQPPIFSILNNFKNMPPFPSNQVPVDYTVQSLLSNQKNFSPTPAFFHPASNNNNSSLNSLFNNTMPTTSNTNGQSVPLLNPQSPEWAPSTHRGEQPDLSSMLKKISISDTSPTWTQSTNDNPLKLYQPRASPSEDNDHLNESSHYWLPADLTQTSSTLEEEVASPWVMLKNLPGNASEDFLAKVLCNFGVIKSLTLNRENNYALACFQDKSQAMQAKNEVNSTGLNGNTRVHVEYVQDWNFENPFRSTAEGSTDRPIVEQNASKNDMGYTTPGGLWIPNNNDYFYGSYGVDSLNGVEELEGGLVSGTDDLINTGSMASGDGLITRGLMSDSALIPESLLDDVVSGSKKSGVQKEKYEDKYQEEELKNLEFLFDEPYEGPLNKPS